MEFLSNPEIWVGLVTLIALEIVLGIDNIVFISILANKLPEAQQSRARRVGLSLAMLTRIALLFSISWVIRLTAPLFVVFGQEISGRDLILIGGGLFLLANSTREIHDRLEGEEEGHASAGAPASFWPVIVQIMLLDIVFSLDSVITAVGLVEEIGVMVTAVVVAVLIMLVSADTISEFVNRRPTVKMLALSFLLLIGMTLVGEGAGLHIPKGYIYFAMAFSLFVELLNLQLRTPKDVEPVKLRARFPEGTTAPPAGEPAPPGGGGHY